MRSTTDDVERKYDRNELFAYHAHRILTHSMSLSWRFGLFTVVKCCDIAINYTAVEAAAQ